MGTKKLKFWRTDYSQDDAITFEVDQWGDSDDLRWAAEQFGEHYYNERDGWECSWPMEFTVAKEDGTILGRVDIDKEDRPYFTSHVLVEYKK